MKLLKYKLRAVLAFLQVFTVLFFAVSLSLFAHIHTLPDGRIIVHSHAVPTQDNDKAAHHEHSQSQLVVHHLASNIDLPLLPTVGILFILVMVDIAHPATARVGGITIFRPPSDRAPPFTPIFQDDLDVRETNIHSGILIVAL